MPFTKLCRRWHIEAKEKEDPAENRMNSPWRRIGTDDEDHHGPQLCESMPRWELELGFSID